MAALLKEIAVYVYVVNGIRLKVLLFSDVFNSSSVPGSAFLLAGQNMSSFDIIIKETVFLRRGASFVISLTAVQLVTSK